MVCAKCQKLSKSTALATPGVKKKNDMYYGSPAGSISKSGDKTKTSATLGQNGIGKVSCHEYSKCELGWFANFLNRVNCYPRPPKIHTQHIPAPVQHARPRLTRGARTARSVHTRQMV
jgi:hypothetical protein